MRWKLLDRGPPATYAIVLAHGDEAMQALPQFVREQKIDAAALTAIGAFEQAVIGYFDCDKKDYKRIPVEEQVEVLSLLGDVAEADGEPALHIQRCSAGRTAASSSAICSKAMCGRPWR
jgi:uncharacterized protein